ncbi:hypothetical protein IWQ62_003945 [Dispira parvispora]|uniref:Nuclear speckle splicing regulatory protein 1 N-terminal domain-containing protein n=1 Tax=Dispira parvispora TaxID=1520584 RepID=A0A9W8AMW7_9FUNG|nr:hypothetical protein IWQ62_003945 [Dispira parvispora]
MQRRPPGFSKTKPSTEVPVDPSIYAYDEVYDAMKESESRALAAEQTSRRDEGPKYINNLLKRAQLRKEEQALVRERKLQREREQEGDEFDDKEKFVTSAYKKHREEVMKRQAQEDAKEAQEIHERSNDRGASFYRGLLEQTSQYRARTVQNPAPAELQRSSQPPVSSTDNPQRVHLPSRGDEQVAMNDDQQIVDKRQLLSAGLNIMKSKPRSTPPAAASSLPRARQAHLHSHNPSKRHSFSSTQSHDYTSRSSNHRTQRRPFKPMSKSKDTTQSQNHLYSEALLKSLERRNDDVAIAHARERYFLRRQARLAL